MRSGQESFTKLKHFVGVVENRVDPKQLGRVQVRVFGIHTSDKTAIPTEDLPWAAVVAPITSASLSGIGTSPTGMIEGTWVFGLFIDGSEYQTPVVLGTLTGMPSEDPDPSKGFNDPQGQYPLDDPQIASLAESSVSRLARTEEAEKHSHLINKRKGKDQLGTIESALAPKVTSVLADKADAYYTRTSWVEPHPRFGGQGNTYPEGVSQSTYPLNHVTHSESGHVLEMDDTPGGERLHMYHAKGSFIEIQPDGSKVTKVVGNDYEITIGDKDVYVKGSVNLTIDGDVRQVIHGNKIEEVDGDYMLTVRGDYVKKVAGNEAKEIMSDKATNVNGAKMSRVAKEYTKITVGNMVESIMGMFTKTTSGEEKRTNISSMTQILPDNYTLAGAGNMTIKAGNTLTISSDTEIKMHSGANTTMSTSANSNQIMESSKLLIKNDADLTGTFTASTEVQAGGETKVTLTGHTHITSVPNSGTGTATDQTSVSGVG
jgi:hypothetical protein